MWNSVLARRPVLLGLAALAVAATLAPVAAGAQARPAAGAPFKVRIIVGLTSLASRAPELIAGAQAAAAQVNKQGGYGGRPVEISYCDHQASPTLAATCANQAVADNVDDVICFSGSSCPSVDPIVAAHNIPQIGEVETSAADMLPANHVPVVAATVAQAAGSMYLALKGSKAGRWASIGQTSPGTTLIVNVAKTYAKHNGVNWVGDILFPASTDLTSFAQKEKDLQPDVIFAPLSTLTFDAFINAAQQIGLKTKWVSFTEQVGQSDVDLMADHGATLTLAGSVPPATATTIPAVKQYQAALRAANLYNDENLRQLGMVGWLDIWAMKKLSQQIKGSVTSASMLAAARKARNIDMFGLFKWSPADKGPAPYPNAPQDSVWLEHVVNGKIVLAQKQPVHAWKILGISRSK